MRQRGSSCAQTPCFHASKDPALNTRKLGRMSVQISTLRIGDAANAQIVQGTRTGLVVGLASDSMRQTEALALIQACQG